MCPLMLRRNGPAEIADRTKIALYEFARRHSYLECKYAWVSAGANFYQQPA